MKQVILLKLPMPTSKNALHVPVRCGKFTKMVRSKKAKLRGQEIVAAIWKQLGGVLTEPIFTGPVSIEWTLTPRNKRLVDRQNYLEHLADCLEEAKVVANDRLLVHEVSEMMPVPVSPGWVDVTITELPQ